MSEVDTLLLNYCLICLYNLKVLIIIVCSTCSTGVSVSFWLYNSHIEVIYLCRV